MSTSNLFTIAKQRFKQLGLSLNVTRRALSLGDRDGTTGWRAKSFSETTIEMVIIPRGSSYLFLVPGTIVRYDAVAFSLTQVAEGDEVVDSENEYYEVKTIEKNKIGDKLYCYKCDLAKLPLHS